MSASIVKPPRMWVAINIGFSLLCFSSVLAAAVTYKQPLARIDIAALPVCIVLGAMCFVIRFRRRTTVSFKRAYYEIKNITAGKDGYEKLEANQIGRLIGERHVGYIVSALAGSGFGLNIWAWGSIIFWIGKLIV